MNVRVRLTQEERARILRSMEESLKANRLVVNTTTIESDAVNRELAKVHRHRRKRSPRR